MRLPRLRFCCPTDHSWCLALRTTRDCFNCRVEVDVGIRSREGMRQEPLSEKFGAQSISTILAGVCLTHSLLIIAYLSATAAVLIHHASI